MKSDTFCSTLLDPVPGGLLLLPCLAIGIAVAVGCSDDTPTNGTTTNTTGAGTMSATTGAGTMTATTGTMTATATATSTTATSTTGTSTTGGATTTGGTTGGEVMTVEHNVCADIPSVITDPNFMISSPEFENCGQFPPARTCDGQAFGVGSSPALMWSGAPEGTQSFALVFKDISIEFDMDPATRAFAFHSAIWDIPATTTSLPAMTGSGHLLAEVPGARQWSGRNEYAFFPPCPNPFAFDHSHPAFPGEYVIDSYSFTLYAFSVPTLTDLPDPVLDDKGTPETDDDAYINYIVTLDDYLKAHASLLGVTEYRATSDAKAASFDPPTAVQYPCTATWTTDCLAAPGG